jgi:peptidoglycan/LPS O-acetylase OafA/YrhL
MLGTLRFMLAVAVAFSHMGLTPNFHFGVAAVMVFYLIAGYVMSYSFQVNFENNLRNIPSFYVDRFFRIYPLYILSLIAIVALVMLTGYGKLYLDPRSIFVNLTVFELNSHPTILNPPAWSLGTEAQFYLMLPFLVRFRKLKYALLLASYAVFVVASLQLIDAVSWGYKLLPGTLFLFIAGSIIFDIRSDTTGFSVAAVVAMAVVGTAHLALLALSPARIDQPYSFEVLTGLIFGGLCVLVLGESRPAYRALDDRLGKLSYPVFLSHVCVLYFFDHLRAKGILVPSPRGAVALQLIASVALSVPFMLFDDYFQRLRKRIQVRNVDRQRRKEAASEREPVATA